MRLAGLGLALLLAACGRTVPQVPLGEDTPGHQACRTEAQRSPGVAALNAQRNTLNQWNTDRLAKEQQVVSARAYRDCLQARGLAAPGGVEPVRPR
ncbi:hypothetical protein GCM10011504_12570 [Siccirubricoccus deserti]|uniref:Phosphoribosylamine--glycine ligase n=1 Tax=Siccirubricoccus deserti TaxID=2013562 RepID=A0A9X0QXT1_9PROT|nr:phosphoribosylamine--glycine ligase [Siccirubricoccus deserti]MBC4014868.1 phosphoribosylamine--glycine ligase [Siccirubricoccus deserti]GGC35662.1 hypothetical protein GCM10011504_12570 [Siccirubricoccus deserti]